MTDKPYDVLAIGNAIVDVLAKVDDNFLPTHGLEKGAMTLIDAERALYLSGMIDQATMRSGGSAGNTIVALAELGASTAYIGKVADDDMGSRYRFDMEKAGVHFPTPTLSEQEPTARSIIVITPDGERTMNTYLGACVEITDADVDEEMVAAAKIIYFEGYLWDPPRAKEAFRLAAKKAHENSNKVAFTLSDSFCVDRYRSEFRELIQNGTIDILFANEDELCALYETDDFDAALARLSGEVKMAAITRGEKGAVIVKDNTMTSCDAFPVSEVIDTTGAGDMFAAGFLYGLSQNYTLSQAGRLGCLLASHIIQVIGPRLGRDLKEIAAQAEL